MFQWMMGNLPGTKQPLAGDRLLRGRDSALVGRSTLGRLLQPLLHASVAVVAFIAMPALSAGLNDTGITFCGNFLGNNADCSWESNDGGPYPRQDARYGRDAENDVPNFNKIGAGGKGFDYTKIANNGNERPTGTALGSDATDWACTRDNVTGLTWEVKTLSGLRNVNHTYSWYSGDITSNANFNVLPNQGICDTPGSCDTEKYVAAVNFAGLCGATDWRMPTAKELGGLTDFSQLNPAIDRGYFPNTMPSSPYWSGTASANLGDATSKLYAWVVNTTDGRASSELRATPKFVRLVRGKL